VNRECSDASVDSPLFLNFVALCQGSVCNVGAGIFFQSGIFPKFVCVLGFFRNFVLVYALPAFGLNGCNFLTAFESLV
jgi:hypothetical protein